MLPAPIWPLAEHAEFGQNCFDASIGSAVFVCICTSCRWIPLFSSFPPPFHRLVGLYRSLGTAPLTGERAQRDFPRSSSWTLRHVGIRQRPGTGTSSWTFGQGWFCHRVPTGTSSSLRLDPRCRSDLVP